MNSIDIAIIVIVLLSGALGLYWGLIRQVLSVAGVAAGVVAAGRYGPQAAEALLSFITDGALAQALGFVLVFAAVSGAASLAASLLHRFVGLLFLGWLDHLLGGVLGAAQGALVSAVLLLAAAAFPHPAWAEALGASRIAPTVVGAASAVLLPLLPETYHFAAQMMLGLP
ncbi:MAG TPA: CvpA family protein [Roseiflexaceae bacterium]|nr:CvpA family protein [Roseiflexaceae bacterium]